MTTKPMNMTMPPDASKRSCLRLALLLSQFGGLLGLAPPAHALAASGPMQVQATVTASCVIGASALTFPSATSAAIGAGPVDSAGSVTVNCTMAAPYSIALNAGLSTGATVAIRQMKSGAQILGYTIYSDAARTKIWGDGTVASTPVTGVGAGSLSTITAYGRIFTAPNVTAGVYVDTINVTVTY
jgi:spore coat protein U-like protein